MTNGVPSLDDLTNALAPMKRGFFIRGFLTHLLIGFLTGLLSGCSKGKGKVIFRNFQSTDGLYFSNQERPRITGFDGVLMTLKIIWLLWPSNVTSKGIVSCVTLPEDKGRPS